MSVCILLKVALLFIMTVGGLGLPEDEAVEPLDDMLDAAMLWSLSLVFKDVPPASDAGGVRITLAKRMGWSPPTPGDNWKRNTIDLVCLLTTNTLFSIKWIYYIN